MVNTTSLSNSILIKETGIPWWKSYIELDVLQWFIAAYLHIEFYSLTLEKENNS